jgi:hypothetical protein
MNILTIKTYSLYCACSPMLGVISYGACRDEAINNLEDEVRQTGRVSQINNPEAE